MERSEVAVLDTHAWVWWVSSPDRLSRNAQRRIDDAAETSAIYISAISVWELSLLVIRKRVHLRIDVADWIARCEALPFLNFVPVDNLVALKANDLPDYVHRDPADRMIIATALLLGGTLITQDRKIRNYPHVSSLW